MNVTVCVGSYPDCSTCPTDRDCYRDEPSSEPALTSGMVYCYNGTNSCVTLSTDPNNPTKVPPPDGAGHAYIGLASVTAPANSRGIFYDMALETKFSFDGWDTSRFVDVTSQVVPGVVYHASGKDASLMYCADTYWCAGDADPLDPSVACTEVQGYFILNNPPKIEDIRVVENEKIKCMLTSGGVSRWTGLQDDTDSLAVNNPIDIAITVSDLDGWDDVDTVWLDVAKNNDPSFDMSAPFSCYNELVDYFAVALYTDALELDGYQKALAIEIPEGFCSPNCGYSSQGTCDAKPGCTWDPDSYFTNPSSCMCSRDFSELGFNANDPLYKFDRSCEWPNRPGEYTECHGCYYQTVHPNYTILGVTETVQSATTVTYTFSVKFNDTFPFGLQQFYGMARSGSIYSGIDDCGSYFDTCRTSDPSWTWGFDFSEPTGSIEVGHESGTPANQIEVTDTISDSGDSGISRLYDRRYWIVRNGSTVATGVVPPGEQLYNGEDSATLGPTSAAIPGVQGGDVVHVADIRADIACNLQDTEADGSSGTVKVGQRWLKTRLGDVYGYGGFDDPIMETGTALSEYWVGGETGGSPCSTLSFGSGIGSAQTPWWCSALYSDENQNANRSTPWYEELYRLASSSNWIQTDQPDGLISIPSGDVAVMIADADPSSEGIYEVEGTSVSLPANLVCSGKKVFFFPGTIDLITVDPDLTLADGQSACLFIVEDAVIHILAGNDKCPSTLDPLCVLNNYDVLQAAFITDSLFDVENDPSLPRYDRLDMLGFVFSDSANFGRDLIWEDNQLYPAETITYDPRYLGLLKEMLGRKPFTDLECGIVTGVGSCENWWGM